MLVSGGHIISTLQCKEALLIKTYGLGNSAEMVEKSSINPNELYFEPQQMELRSIDFMRVPRLEWDDRNLQLISYDTEEAEVTKKMPPRLIIAGSYQSSKDKGRDLPYVGLLDTTNWRRNSANDNTMIKCFSYSVDLKPIKRGENNKEALKITALNYGPYDNGHIILGFNSGAILIVNSLDLSSMFRLFAFDSLPVSLIIFDPT